MLRGRGSYLDELLVITRDDIGLAESGEVGGTGVPTNETRYGTGQGPRKNLKHAAVSHRTSRHEGGQSHGRIGSPSMNAYRL